MQFAYFSKVFYVVHPPGLKTLIFQEVFPGGLRPLDPPRTPPGVKISKKYIFDQNLVGANGGQIWSPTLEFLLKCIFFKNDPPPLGTLKYPPEDQFEIFMIFSKQ